MTYQEYLKSPTWLLLRKQRMAMDSQECVLCGNTAEHVHHRRYPEQWGTETVGDLVSLCGSCHSKFHDGLASGGINPLTIELVMGVQALTTMMKELYFKSGIPEPQYMKLFGNRIREIAGQVECFARE